MIEIVDLRKEGKKVDYLKHAQHLDGDTLSKDVSIADGGIIGKWSLCSKDVNDEKAGCFYVQSDNEKRVEIFEAQNGFTYLRFVRKQEDD